MTITAIPTLYNGIQFRSRLEAKWAAMFDIIGWSYAYEPMDFPGWIPDFLVHGERPFLVEVKPYTDACRVGAGLNRKISGALGSMDEMEVLVCPIEPDFSPWCGYLSFGPLKSPRFNDWGASLVAKIDGRWGIRSDIYGGWDRITGDLFSTRPLDAPVNELRSAWSNACNLTQWRGAAALTHIQPIRDPA